MSQETLFVFAAQGGGARLGWSERSGPSVRAERLVERHLQEFERAGDALHLFDENDGRDRLRAAGGNASGGCDAVEFLRGMSDLRRSDATGRLLILVDDAPPWRRYSELFSCPLLPVQFTPAGETEAEALAEHLLLSSDQRQFVG